jgi:YVTN family beta-propeller protein
MNRRSRLPACLLVWLAVQVALADGPDAGMAASSDVRLEPLSSTWLTPRPVEPSQGHASRAEVTFLTVNCDPEGDMPRNVAFTPDGTVAVIVNRDTDNLTFFDVATQTITHTVAVEDFPVDVAVTPDGQYALAPNVFSNTVSVVNVATHSAIAHVPITGDQPYRVAVTSDSRYVVVGVINDAANSSFSVIDLATLSEVLSFPSASQGVFGWFSTPESGIFGNIFTQFALSPDDTTIVLPDRGNARVVLYDRIGGSELAALSTAEAPTAVDVSIDGTVAVVSHESSAKTITEIDLITRTVSGSFSTDNNLTGQIIRITPDKSHAMAAISNNVIFVNLTDGTTTATLYTGSVGDIELSFDGQYAFVSNYNARVIDIASQTIVKTVTFAACMDSAASPVEHRAVALNNRFRENVHLYNINGASGFFEGWSPSGEPPEGDATRTLAITPDGATLVAANNVSQNVSIIDLSTQTVRSYVDTGDRPLGVAVTPDGNYAVVCNGDDDRVSVIDLTTDTRVANLAVHTRPAEVRISPDSQYAYVTTVASTDRLHFIELDGADSEVVGSLITGQMGSMIYTYNVLSGIELSSDGSVLALCISFDDELLLVDTATQSELTRVPVGDFPIRAAFAPDGSEAYVTNANSDDVYVVVIDGESSYVEAVVPGIDFPLTVTVDVTGSFVYVGSFSSSSPAIKVIDAATNSIVKTVRLNGRPRAAYISPADSILYVATTEAELVRIDAAGPDSAIIDTTLLSAGPSDMVFSEALHTAVVAQPIPDGVDLVFFGCAGDLDGDGDTDHSDLGILLADWGCVGSEPEDCPGDLDGDFDTDHSDLGILLADWGCGT